MSEYAKVRVQCEHSGFSDYGSSIVHNMVDEITPDNATVKRRIIAPGSGTGAQAIHTTNLTTCLYLVIFNTGSIAVTTTHVNAAAATVTSTLGAGKVCVFADVDPSTSPTIVSSTTATVDCEVTILGT